MVAALLVFHHIPKTGGTTIRKLLQPNLGEISFLHLNEQKELERIARNQKAVTEFTTTDWARIRIVFGHAVHQNTGIDCGRQRLVCSVLRDPVAWLISKYNQEMRKYHRDGVQPLAFEKWYRIAPLSRSLVDWLVRYYLSAPNLLGRPQSEKRKIALNAVQKLDFVVDLRDLDTCMPSLLTFLCMPIATPTRANAAGLDYLNHFSESGGCWQAVVDRLESDLRFYEDASPLLVDNAKKFRHPTSLLAVQARHRVSHSSDLN